MPASDFALSDGFGNLSDGTHTAGVTREILGKQWTGFSEDFAIVDIGDGRKWMTTPGAGAVQVALQSGTFADMTTAYLGFLVKPTDRTPGFIIYFMDGASVLGYLYINSTGQVCYYAYHTNPAYSSPLITSSAIPLNTPTHVEMAVVFDNAVGSVTIWLNGVQDSQVLNQDTIADVPAGTACDSIYAFDGTFPLLTEFGYLPGGWELTDVILHDLGDHAGVATVGYRPGSADGADTDFTPSVGVDHYAMVDEIGPDEDVTYNASDGTAGHRDSYENAGVSGLTVLTVQSVHRARKTGTGAATIIPGMEHGGSEDQGDPQALAADYLTLTDFFDVNPSTAAAWTVGEVSAAEVTVEVG